MFLHSSITTIPRPSTAPVTLCDLGYREGTKVTVPYMDSITASGVTVDMSEDADVVDALMDYGAGVPGTDMPVGDQTLAVALKILYREQIAFWGPISVPVFDYDTGKIELAAHDPTLRLDAGYVVAGDSAIDPGVTVDGAGLLALLALGQNRPNQDLLNWPSLGLVAGTDTSTASATRRKFPRGSKLWTSIKELANLEVGPDFRIVFIDTNPAAYARVDTFNKVLVESNPQPECIFHKGHGKDNARVLSVSPLGDRVRNQFIATSKNGTKIRVKNVSREDYGTYQGYEAPNGDDSLTVLAAYADAQVRAYHRPLKHVELAPVDDSGYNDTLRYLEDFDVGSYVQAIGKRGRSYHDVLVQITQVELTQHASHVSTDLQMQAAGEGGAVDDA